MKKISQILGTGAFSFAMIACTTNPITGRQSLQIANNQEISAMALQQYKETLSKSKAVHINFVLLSMLLIAMHSQLKPL